MKKINTLLISIAMIVVGMLPCYAQENESESESFKNWTPPENFVIDTRVDNMGYWVRLAELGYIPFSPENPLIESHYTGNQINSPYVLSPISTDVPVITGSNTQSENSVFVNPLVSGSVLNSNNSTPWPVSGIYGANNLYTTNTGTSWGGTTGGAGGSNSGDPAACISRNGRYYIGYINSSSGQSVSWATNINGPWTAVVSGTTNSMNDKNHLWVDNSPTSPYVNNLYDSWTQFGSPNTNQIEIVRSTNGGLNWSAKLNISASIAAGSHNQGVNITTGPNGEVYVFWAVYDSWPSVEATYAFCKSTNGGSTYTTATRFLTGCKGIRSTGALFHNIRTNSFPSACCDLSNCPTRGNLYMVWTNNGVPGVNTGSDFDVYIVKSTNQGTNWSAPIRVTNDALGNGKKVAFPWITCDPVYGNLSVVFYDDRNCSATQAETWVANSTNGGANWDNFKVSDVAFTPSAIPGLAGGYMGDYLGITALNGDVYPCWSDNRDGVQRTYVSPYTLPCTCPVVPAVSIAITSGSNPTCAGASVTFTATPTNGGTTPSYQWKVNGGNVGTGPTYTTTTLTNGQIVTCVMTSSNTCASPNPATSNAITMIVNASFVPAVSIAITSGTNPTCAGISVTFTATPTNGGGTPSYQWKVNGGNVGTGPTYTSTTLANGDIVTCVMTSSLSCAVPSTATSNAITMTVNASVVPAVSIAITSGSNPCCAGSSVTFTATPTNGGSSPSYQWKVNGGNVGTGPTYTSTTLANGDIVTCVMTSNASCAVPPTATSNAITMTVNPIPPKPTITQNGNLLTSSAPTGNQWYLNGSIIPGATGQTYTVIVNGTYTVQVTLNGCVSPFSDPVIITNVGINVVNNDYGLSIFPNPNDGKFTVTFISNEKSNYKIEIVDAIGQQVFKENINNLKGTYIKRISLLEYGKGVYTIKLTNSYNDTFKKIIIY